jgi:hypothetical protein
MKLPYHHSVKNANYNFLFLSLDHIYTAISARAELLCLLGTPSTLVLEALGLNFGFGFLGFVWPYRKIPGSDYNHFLTNSFQFICYLSVPYGIVYLPETS